MSEPRKAYVVTYGNYSDYSIAAVFLDKVEADKYVEIANRGNSWQEYTVEEFDVGESAKKLAGPFVHFRSSVDVRGNVLQNKFPETTSIGPTDLSWHNRVLRHFFVKDAYKMPDGASYATVQTAGHADETERMRKVHSERLAQVRQEMTEGIFEARDLDSRFEVE